VIPDSMFECYSFLVLLGPCSFPWCDLGILSPRSDIRHIKHICISVYLSISISIYLSLSLSLYLSIVVSCGGLSTLQNAVASYIYLSVLLQFSRCMAMGMHETAHHPVLSGLLGRI
jgi:hypothetical protein